uniref:Uncharacterized protein n=1 Tax=Anguilla anguilla TaxID=7936 RepID=A0A0E9PZ59_ANGAN
MESCIVYSTITLVFWPLHTNLYTTIGYSTHKYGHLQKFL